jgi:hypothetical protein
MKKLILLIFILYFTITIKAQTWCAQGAQWHYRVYSVNYPYTDGYIQLTNTGTITVGGKVCDNLVGNMYGVFMYSGFPTTTLSGYANVQTYQNNNVVYVHNNETLAFDTLVNFNATIGDKWQLINYPASLNTSSCGFSRPICTVINTGTILINSQTLKTVQITHQLYSQTYTNTIIEKIGTITDFLFPYYHCIIDGPSYGNFVCYSDNSFALYNPSGVACNFTTVGLKNNSFLSENISVYPNPTNGSLNIEAENASKVQVVSLLGQLVKEEELKIENKKTDISTLQNGVYFLKVFDKDKLIGTTKIIKE